MELPRPAERHAFRDFVLDLDRGTLTRNGADVPLRPKSYAVLQYLVDRQGTLVSRDELIQAVWGHLHVTDSSLSQCLRDIRQALGDQEQQLIHTVPGRGYRFERQDVSPDVDSAAEAGESALLRLRRPAVIIAALLIAAALGYFLVRGAFVPGGAGEAGSGLTTPVSIALLPLLDLSPEGNFGYFADGLSEDLLNLLAGIEELEVAARTSSFYFKDKLGEIPLSEIGKQLQVTHVLEGSVRKDGERIRISAQLIEVDSGFHVWSDSWDRTLDDVFAIQNEIAAAVAAALQINLLGDAPKTRAIDPESYELALQARFLYTRRDEGDLQQAAKLFERAVEIDPDNAVAWVGLAPLYLWLFDPPRIEDALNATERAVALDPTNPEAWSRRATALRVAGNASFREAWARAESLGDDNSLIQSQIAGHRTQVGDFEGAIEAQQRAVALDPLNPGNLLFLSELLIRAGRLDEAGAHADKVLILTPNGSLGLTLMADLRLLQGRPEEARDLIGRRTVETGGLSGGVNSSRIWYEVLIAHAQGNQAGADDALAQFIAENGAEQPLSVACLYAWREDRDAAFQWLDRALELHPDLSVRYSWEPWLNSLEEDPRWAELLQRWTGTQTYRRI
jgi:TolB-like protein/DNA-binding winged helix-turn-helix (wHTH) protein/Flp pilus assembly protein TadD